MDNAEALALCAMPLEWAYFNALVTFHKSKTPSGLLLSNLSYCFMYGYIGFRVSSLRFKLQ